MSIRILCVDDNVPLVTTWKLLFSRLGYDVLTATNAQDARRLFHSTAIDLAIVDYHLPEVLGDELCTEFKEMRPSLRVILVSGDYPDRDCECADQFVLKGQSPNVLLQAVSELTRQAA